jgi:hypothetical protein
VSQRLCTEALAKLAVSRKEKSTVIRQNFAAVKLLFIAPNYKDNFSNDGIALRIDVLNHRGRNVEELKPLSAMLMP